MPLFQPDLPGHGDRLDQVFDDCMPSVVVTTHDKRELVEKLIAGRGLTGRVALLLPEDVAGRAGAADAAAFAPPADLTLDDVAYLQYTSGSTRAPRGVVLTQLNLVYNIFQIIQAHAMDEMVPGRHRRQLAAAVPRHGPAARRRGDGDHRREGRGLRPAGVHPQAEPLGHRDRAGTRT